MAKLPVRTPFAERKTPTHFVHQGGGATPGTGTHPRLGARARVLVVDDDAAERAMLEVMLRDAGYDPSGVADGAEALEVLQRVPRNWFALVVIDQRMPRMMGLEVLARTASRARFVVLTGVRDPALRATAMSLGAEEVFTKPVDPAELLARVRTILAEE